VLPRPGGGDVPLLSQSQRHVDDHVFLAADVAEFTDPLQDLVRGDAVAVGGPFGVQQETAVDAGPALHDRGPVHLRPARKERPDYFFRGRKDAADIYTSLDAQMIECRGEHLGGGVARAGAERAERAIDLPSTAPTQ
jgi:hypothetical protein